MEFTRIIQLTDIHLLPGKDDRILGIDSCQSLHDILFDIESLEVPPMLIVATGDLAEDGSEVTYERLKGIFDKINFPVFVVPGNHDNVANMKASLVSESIKMQTNTEVQGWVIAFVNSQVLSQDYGFIDEQELSRLESTLSKANGKPCMVALHHSLTPECASPECQLKNTQELLELMGRYPNVKAVIAGHTHCCTEAIHSNIALLTTPSTFLHANHAKQGESQDHDSFEKSHQFDGSRRGYRIIDLFENGDINSEVRWIHSGLSA